MFLEGPANPHGALCARGLSCAPWPALACRLVESSKCPSLPNACGPGLVPGPWTGSCGEHCPLLLQGCPQPQGLSLSTPPWTFSALKAVVPGFGDGRWFVASGRLVVVWTCSRPSLLRWKPATDSPATFLRVWRGQGGRHPLVPWLPV